MHLNTISAVCLLLVSLQGSAKSDAGQGNLETVTGTQAAAGFGLSWQSRQDYGKLVRSNFVPELLGLAYIKTSVPRLFLRPGARIAYSGLEQAEYPMGLVMREHDLMASGEFGVVYDGLIAPSLATGVGLDYRRIGAKSSLPGVDVNVLRRSEYQPFVYVQAGIGVSIHRGLIILEPFARYERIRRDERSHWRFGLDLSVQLF